LFQVNGFISICEDRPNSMHCDYVGVVGRTENDSGQFDYPIFSFLMDHEMDSLIVLGRIRRHLASELAVPI
jgi:hypothetical protein